MDNSILTIIDQIDHCVTSNDAVHAPEALRRELALLQNRYSYEQVMSALCQAYVIADRRRQGAEARLAVLEQNKD